MAKPYPSIERLRQVLSYDPATGEMRWLRTLSARAVAGSVAGSAKAKYVQVRVDGVLMNAHRVAWAIHYGEWPAADVDHINMNGKDNRICNLRAATRSQNKYNTTKNRLNTSGYKGVDFVRKRGNWRVRISVGGAVRNLGAFDDPELAGLVYAEAARKWHGEFARAE